MPAVSKFLSTSLYAMVLMNDCHKHIASLGVFDVVWIMPQLS